MEKILFKNWPYRTTPLNENNLNALQTNVENALNNKVDKIEGKGLSTNDYTTSEKNKLAGIEAGANKTTIVDILTSTSATEGLSANQGKKLNEEKFDKIGGTITGDVNITGSLQVLDEILTNTLPSDNGWSVMVGFNGKKIFKRRYTGSVTINANSGSNLVTILMPVNLPNDYIRKLYPVATGREIIYNWHPSNIIQLHNVSNINITLSNYVIDLEIEEK